MAALNVLTATAQSFVGLVDSSEIHYNLVGDGVADREEIVAGRDPLLAGQ